MHFWASRHIDIWSKVTKVLCAKIVQKFRYSGTNSTNHWKTYQKFVKLHKLCCKVIFDPFDTKLCKSPCIFTKGCTVGSNKNSMTMKFSMRAPYEPGFPHTKNLLKKLARRAKVQRNTHRTALKVQKIHCDTRKEFWIQFQPQCVLKELYTQCASQIRDCTNVAIEFRLYWCLIFMPSVKLFSKNLLFYSAVKITPASKL